MSKHEVTVCDFCYCQISLYHGASVDIVEGCGNMNRASKSDRVCLDLCDACYAPIANIVRSIEGKRMQNAIQSVQGRTRDKGDRNG